MSTAFEKQKLRHNLGRPSRSDFVHFEFFIHEICFKYTNTILTIIISKFSNKYSQNTVFYYNKIYFISQLKIFNPYSFPAQRCSTGTTLLNYTFLPFADCSAKPQAVSLVNGSTLSLTTEVSPAREHLCFFTLSQFATHGCVMLTRQIKMQFLRFSTKSHFYLSPFASRMENRYISSFPIYASIRRSTTGIRIVFSFNALTPSAINSPIRTRFSTTSITATIEYAPVR